ncbi:MAG TPA: HAD-IIIA family hydrolase [Coriobacteriia bacterium]|nr:HAD-IIIA family hydrolase [Coriobacteriia bacterium]
MNRFDAVFFDVGNTLLHPYPSVSEVVRQVLCGYGHTHDLDAIDSYMPLVDEYYEDRYREDDTFWTSEAETSAVWVGMYSLLCRKLGIDAAAEEIAQRVYEEFGDPQRWKPYADVEPAFRRLKDAGVKVGLISNWDRRLPRIMEGLGLASYVDVTVVSAEVGLRKPDPRIFELALQQADVVPERAAHVGDHHYADIVGANAVGMTAVLIDRHGGPCVEPGAFVRTLDDLEKALEA